MIHLRSEKTDTSFCGTLSKNDLLTSERPPHDRQPRNLCQHCVQLYRQYLADQQLRRLEAWNNRSTRQKLHDWLRGLSYFGESDMGVILDLMIAVATCGLVFPAKHLAKLLLKLGI